MTATEYLLAVATGLSIFLLILLVIVLGAYSDLVRKLKVRAKGQLGELVRLDLGPNRVDFVIRDIHADYDDNAVRVLLQDVTSVERTRRAFR